MSGLPMKDPGRWLRFERWFVTRIRPIACALTWHLPQGHHDEKRGQVYICTRCGKELSDVELNDAMEPPDRHDELTFIDYWGSFAKKKTIRTKKG